MGDDAALLTDFLDGALTPAEHARVVERLAREPDLAEQLEQAEAARNLLMGLKPAAVPADFARKTRRQLRRKRAFRVRSFGLGRFGIEVFAILVLVAMAVLWFSLELGSNTPTVPDSPASSPPSNP